MFMRLLMLLAQSLVFALSGYKRAAIFNKCHLPDTPCHMTQVVFSPKYGFLYVDNVKAGSSLVRGKLAKIHANWFYNPGDNRRAKRMQTDDLNASAVIDAFVFSVVRNPVDKFESGVRQAWSQNKRLANLTADELLDMQLSSSKWINEHLESSTWRLSGCLRNANRPRFTFLGALENIEVDMALIVANIRNISRAQIKMLAESEPFLNHRGDDSGRSRLSENAVKRMCASEMYRRDWSCFGYDLPAPCVHLPLNYSKPVSA